MRLLSSVCRLGELNGNGIFQKIKVIPEAQAFAVTIKKPGGSLTPSLGDGVPAGQCVTYKSILHPLSILKPDANIPLFVGSIQHKGMLAVILLLKRMVRRQKN